MRWTVPGWRFGGRQWSGPSRVCCCRVRIEVWLVFGQHTASDAIVSESSIASQWQRRQPRRPSARPARKYRVSAYLGYGVDGVLQLGEASTRNTPSITARYPPFIPPAGKKAPPRRLAREEPGSTGIACPLVRSPPNAGSIPLSGCDRRLSHFRTRLSETRSCLRIPV